MMMIVHVLLAVDVVGVIVEYKLREQWQGAIKLHITNHKWKIHLRACIWKLSKWQSLDFGDHKIR